jgi:DNA-binding Lrp family transcriptional regulator
LKYKIKCKSLLLQKALEIFLEEYLDENGKVISDYEGDIIIGKDIKKPFSKSTLLIQLENLENKEIVKEFNHIASENNLEIDIDALISKSFDEKLDELIDEFSQKLKKLIKEEYGKK